jgi:uncharacterized protein (TIGR02186 family)
MRANGYLKQRLAVLLGFVLLLSLPSLAQGASLDLKVAPDVVEIGAWFRGHGVTVSGMIPQGAEAVMEVVGQTSDEHLMRKGRRAGLWMNVGDIDFHGAPSLYMVMSTNPKLLESPSPESPWGYKSLERRVTMSGLIKDQEKSKFLQQFLKLKESEGIYTSFKTPIKKGRAAGDLIPVQGEFRLPTNVKPGTYEVCLSVIKDGQIVAKKCGELKVMLVGFPAMFTTMAYQHGLTYGIIAVVIAIVTGFAMGFLFKGGGGH